MTIGTIPWWLAGMVAALAVVGVVASVRVTWCGLRAGWARLRDRRDFGPDEATEQEQSGLCAGCWDDSEHCDGAYDMCNCTYCWPEDWAEQKLPPERSWEELTDHPEPRLERRLRPWEADIWAAYAAVGLEGTGFTRAMARQVQELAR